MDRDERNVCALQAPSPIQRRGMQLPHIQTSFINDLSQPLQRPSPRATRTIEESGKRASVSNSTATVRNRSAKSGFFGLFSRKRLGKNPKAHKQLAHFDDDAVAPSRPASRRTQASFRTGQTSIAPGNLATPTRSKTLRERASKTALRTRSIKKELTIRAPSTWDPPPLFQVYPQAVKYASLRAPVDSADDVLHSNSEKTKSTKRPNAMQSVINLGSLDLVNAKARAKEDTDQHSSRVQPDTNTRTWAHNLYVLVTSGYFLQYAADGNFDRLPEKIMSLGKDSAAFATDAIAGEHWVLQVSHSLDENGVTSTEYARSIFKKMGFQSSPQRSTSTFLLVLDSAEEMDGWLRAVRGEIEAMGGKKYRPDVSICNSPELAVRQLAEKPSRRYLIKRDPNQFSEQAWKEAPSLNCGDAIGSDGEARSVINSSPFHTIKRQSVATQMSMDSPSVSNATMSLDQAYLDRLRDSPRLSYVSAGAKTLSTSRGSSPGRSLEKRNPSIIDLTSNHSEESTSMISPPADRRAPIQRSTASLESRRTSSDLTPISQSSRPPSICRSSRSIRWTRSPAAANHSIPSGTNHYSIVSNSSTLPSIRASKSTTNIRVSPSPPATKDERQSFMQNTFLPNEPPVLALLSPKATIPQSGLPQEAHHFGQHLPHPTDSGKISMLSPICIRTIPNRLSSLQYSREAPPRRLPTGQLQSPHPPPMTALPDIPGGKSQAIGYDTLHKMPQQSGAILTHPRQPRRPLSVQVRSDPAGELHQYRLQQPVSESICEHNSVLEYPTGPPSDFAVEPSRHPPPPPLQHLKMQNRRSMPHIGRPPDCSLPDIPPLPKIPSQRVLGIGEQPSFEDDENRLSQIIF